MKVFLKKLLGTNTEVSSKRLISLIAIIMIVITWAVDLFTDMVISEFIWTGLLTILGTGIGTVALTDIFGNNKKDDKNGE